MGNKARIFDKTWVRVHRWVRHARLGWIAAASAVVVACGAPEPRGETTGQVGERIYGGVPDSDATSSDAVVALRIGDGTQSYELCTGALIGPSVVLTARHCIAQAVVPTISCDSNGDSTTGPQTGPDVDAKTVHVFTGPKPDLAFGVAVANGRVILHPDTQVLCDSDVALVVLDTPITNIAPLAVRMKTGVAVGESVRAVGYGQNDAGQTVGTRMRKDGMTVRAVGATVSASQTPLASAEIELGESICQGDSGGPAISEATGAVVAVVSRGGQCTDDFGHIYSVASGFVALIDQAFAITGGAPIDESAPPTPGSDAGTGNPSTPTSGNVTGGGDPPNVDDAGASHKSRGVESLQPGSAGGCTLHTSKGQTDPLAFLGFSAALLVVVRRRRRRS